MVTSLNNSGVLPGNSVLFDNFGLVSVEDLADAFGRSPKTIRNWVAKRLIPFVLIQGRVMFRRESIEAWLKRKEFKPWR